MTFLTTSIRLTALAAALAAATLLGACAPLLIGGGLVGGGRVATDPRTFGAPVEVQSHEIKGGKRVGDAIGDRGHVNVTSYNRLVLVTGEVPSEADKTSVEQFIARIENVRSIVNELAIGAPSSIGTRSSDTLITSKVKASIVDAKDIQVAAFKVVTERGNVYLMGRVTEREANRAAEVARGVSGVLKVVKVFEAVSESELAGTAPPGPLPPTSGMQP